MLLPSSVTTIPPREQLHTLTLTAVAAAFGEWRRMRSNQAQLIIRGVEETPGIPEALRSAKARRRRVTTAAAIR